MSRVSRESVRPLTVIPLARGHWHWFLAERFRYKPFLAELPADEASPQWCLRPKAIPREVRTHSTVVYILVCTSSSRFTAEKARSVKQRSLSFTGRKEAKVPDTNDTSTHEFPRERSNRLDSTNDSKQLKNWEPGLVCRRPPGENYKTMRAAKPSTS